MGATGLLDPDRLIFYAGTADGMNKKQPQFLAYDEGDHYDYHFDGLPNARGPEFLRRRIVSVVLFLNVMSPPSA